MMGELSAKLIRIILNFVNTLTSMSPFMNSDNYTLARPVIILRRITVNTQKKNSRKLLEE
jgi:hypothetical protein